MNDYRRIQAAIEYIEGHLQEELHIADIAAQAWYSPFHFQRMFRAISGFTVQEYIRKRRLSEAAQMLRSTGQSILEIALAYQYKSQESFTRAFENCFGISPGKYRKAELACPRQEKINFIDDPSSRKGNDALMKPTIAGLPAKEIVGYAYRTTLNDDRHYVEIPDFYREFGECQRYACIPSPAAPNMAYGVSCEFEDSGEFTFVVGEEVQPGIDAGQLEPGYVHMQLPAGTYAEFKAYGPAHTVQEIRDYIYGTWLPQSNYDRREGPDFEVTDVMKSSYPDEMRIKIYIPICSGEDRK
ncbi:effector binding domain-containing protein [Paenibacillus dendritiformis]|uniref:effector binding domain-containing protein n=1 Tax=Paenibacillus dendritiformis TaxID=130049 RepID=UPI00387E1B76